MCLFCRAVHLSLYVCCNREYSNIFWWNISDKILKLSRLTFTLTAFSLLGVKWRRHSKSKYVWKLTWYADFQVLVCRYWILGVQIWLFQNTTYSNKILVKRLSIQIWISGAFYLPLTTTTCVMLHASGCSGVRLPCRSPSPLSSWTFSTSLMIFISSQFEKSWF